MLPKECVKRVVRLYAVLVGTVFVLSVPLFFERFVPSSFVRSYGLVVERAGNGLVIASLVLAITGCGLFVGCLMCEYDPSSTLKRSTLAAVFLCLLHLVLVPAIGVP